MAVEKGKFITFEGGEGVGKSTQAHELRQRLVESGRKVIETHEPGGTPGAEIVRHLLKSGAVEPLGPFAEAVMISAARDDHVSHLIRPALNKGTWVVCDRFCDSTKAYQGAGGGVDDGLLNALQRITVGETLPDLTIILDAPARIALERAQERNQYEDEGQDRDRFEKEQEPFHNRLRRAFLQIAKENPGRCVVIDATADKQAVAMAVWDAVSERLNP